MTDSTRQQIENAKNHFYGQLMSVGQNLKYPVPNYVYHYTTEESLSAILESGVFRLHTVNNFSDPLERKIRFPVEKELSFTFTDNQSGKTADVSSLINRALSDDHVFVMSTSSSNRNQYLWDNYADEGRGVCLKLSTKRFVSFLNQSLQDFELVPTFLKCAYIEYGIVQYDRYLRQIHAAINSVETETKGRLRIVWPFLVEYFRNLLKTADPYSQERELRLVVSDNYTLFLSLCSILTRWGYIKSPDQVELTRQFENESLRIKQEFRETLNFSEQGSKKFVTVPFQSLFDSIEIGPNSSLSKNRLCILSNGKIKKSCIRKAYSANK